jgi:hypothetical protein
MQGYAGFGFCDGSLNRERLLSDLIVLTGNEKGLRHQRIINFLCQVPSPLTKDVVN